jgi:hypothetical protein
MKHVELSPRLQPKRNQASTIDATIGAARTNSVANDRPDPIMGKQ